MAHDRISGSFVALITPFNRDGSIDYEGFHSLLQFQEEHGTSAVLIMGSTGEVSMLSPEERHEVVRRTLGFRSGRMKFYYGCTGPSTTATIGYLKQAEAEGADGAIIAAPPYICAGEADLDTAKRRELYYEMQAIVRNEGGVAIPMYANWVDAASKKLAHHEHLGNLWQLDGARLAERWWFA